MKYSDIEYSRAAEFVRQFAQEDRSGQMAKIAEMLKHAAAMTVAMNTTRNLINTLEGAEKNE